ncbi:aldehyde dehydrogenase [Coprinellus micaceus]|uniref:Aldehyde dehydrogenase n=1 Tax=Coprinellus micaceus TaxID=71717 RepID=A0A4Y7T7F3_COPMI|nr:aldehyde dehydrogenase [Coprinellus micaceus]
MAFNATSRLHSSLRTQLNVRQRYTAHPKLLGSHDEAQRTALNEFTVVNPATGETLCSVTETSPQEIDRIVSNAQSAFNSGIWSQAPEIHRSRVLSKFARGLEAELPRFAEIETLQIGRTIREMKAQLGRLPDWLDYFAALLRTEQGFVAPTQGQLLNYVQRVPLGVVAQITPFNHPLLIAIKKIAPALAAGNSVIVKPSELAPITVLELAEIAEKAGVPPGVLSVLPGGASVGRTLIENPLIRKVDITAGTKAGRAIGSIVGRNLASFTAELGGKAPIVVFEDADIISAVNGVAFASFVASGQTCVSGTRIIIHSDIYDEFMSRFLSKVKSIREGMGSPLNPQSTMGTIVSQAHLERIHGMVSRTKGKIVAGGERLTCTSSLDGTDFSQGAFYPPTIVTEIPLEDELWREEVFGPVVVVYKFSTEAEGVALANDCKYGLGAGVWTKDISRGHRVAAEIQSGLCWINTHHRNDPSSPWGGFKESGIGRENGVEALHEYSQSKSTIVNIASAEQTRLTDDWFEVSSERRYG